MFFRYIFVGQMQTIENKFRSLVSLFWTRLYAETDEDVLYRLSNLKFPFEVDKEFRLRRGSRC